MTIDPTDPLSFTAIGHVEVAVADDRIASSRREIVSDIVVAERYVPGLLGLEEYSHLIVLFWMDRPRPATELISHPRGDTSLPLTGVFASRGRNHPNPIGLAVVDLLAIVGPRLTVRRLDAYHGTPVIDIKPYDLYDSYTDIRVPAWLRARAG